MTSLATLSVLVAFHLAASTAVGQESTSSLQWGASVRIRYESKQDFNFDDASQDYVLGRERLYLSYTTDAGSEGSVELQDTRVFGESLSGVPPANGNASPNVFEDHLDIHQAS